MSRNGLFILLTLVATPAFAQSARTAPASLDRAAATITEDDVRRRIFIIADDSMMGRDTPSRGLDLTAQYVADQFRRFGLKPGGENGTYFQRYSITRSRLDPAASHVGFAFGASHQHAELSRDARFLYGGIPDQEVGGTAVLLAGALDSLHVTSADVGGKVALVVVDRAPGAMARSVTGLLRSLFQARPAAVVLVSNRDSATFAGELARQGNPRLSVAGSGSDAAPVIEVHERAVQGLLREAGVDVPALRKEHRPVQRDLPGLRVMVDLKQQILEQATAPNTIGLLEGTDPALRNEYVIFSAHMDHVGISHREPGDSINNGADDDASGTAGIVELAEAFSQARPRRSVLFITVSGEEKGLWGSQYFTEHPTVPLEQVIADFNMDMIGRNWKDTIVAIGKEHSDLGATLNRVNEAHPELHMTAIDDRWPEENFYFRSDHYNFARKGVPILFFFNGVHPDYHRPSDSPDKIDAEKEARILKLVFYLGQEVANATERPKWNPESYRQIVEGGGR